MLNSSSLLFVDPAPKGRKANLILVKAAACGWLLTVSNSSASYPSPKGGNLSDFLDASAHRFSLASATKAAGCLLVLALAGCWLFNAYWYCRLVLFQVAPWYCQLVLLLAAYRYYFSQRKGNGKLFFRICKYTTSSEPKLL